MQFRLLAFLILSTAAECLAQSPGTSCDVNDAASAVCAKEQELVQAFLGNDPALVSRVYADDFVMINYRGTIVDKAGVLHALRSGVLRFDSLTVSDLRVRSYATVAVLTGRQRQVAREPGPDERPHAKDIRYTNVYVLRGDVWQLVSTQITPMPAAHVAATPTRTEALRSDSDSTSIRELIALEHILNSLLEDGNWQAYSAHLAEDYRQTTRNGEVRTRDDVIQALQRRVSGTPVGTTTPDSIHVRVYGDTGILTALLTGRRASDGSISFRSRILKTFVRRGGRWYLVAMQGTPLP